MNIEIPERLQIDFFIVAAIGAMWLLAQAIQHVGLGQLGRTTIVAMAILAVGMVLFQALLVLGDWVN